MKLTILWKTQVSMIILKAFMKLVLFYFTVDAETQSGTLLFTDDATIQCVAVSVSSVTAGSTDESCLSLTLSSPTTVSGLTLSPSLGTVCKVLTDGKINILLFF